MSVDNSKVWLLDSDTVLRRIRYLIILAISFMNMYLKYIHILLIIIRIDPKEFPAGNVVVRF